MPVAMPAGIEKRATAPRNPSGRHGPDDGASARKNAGTPIVSDEVSVNCRGSSGKTPVVSAIAISRKAVNTALATNSRATRWMLRRIWRPSWTIRGTSPNSPLTSTRSETERAICVPLPWAIASRACLSAGTSLTPSPSMPTYSPLSASTRTTRALSSGEIRPIAGAATTASSSAGSVSGRLRPSSASLRAGMPASRAIAPTVAGLSPETTFSATSSSAKNATVRSALSRSRSARTTIPSGWSGSGSGASGAAGGSGASAVASARTRRPPAASSDARSRRAPCASSSASGAPSTSRSPSSSSALHRRRDENGTWAAGSRAASPSARPAAWTASRVALRDGALAA